MILCDVAKQSAIENKYSLIIPAHNEQESIVDVLDDALHYMSDAVGEKCFEIIVVDDASTDNTKDLVLAKKSPHIIFLEHKYNRGVGAARTTGLSKANGNKILFTDADMTYSAEDFPKIIESLNEFDMVIGAREKEKGTLPMIRASVKFVFRKLAGWLTHTEIPDLNSGLRGMDKGKTLEFLHLLPTGHSWVSTITLCFLSSGYSVNFVPINYDKRRGKSTFKIISDSYAMFMTIVKTVVYFYPLRVIMPISFFFGLGGCVFLLRDFFQKNIADTTILLFVVGVILFVFSLMSEQLANLRRELARHKSDVE